MIILLLFARNVIPIYDYVHNNQGYAPPNLDWLQDWLRNRNSLHCSLNKPSPPYIGQVNVLHDQLSDLPCELFRIVGRFHGMRGELTQIYSGNTIPFRVYGPHLSSLGKLLGFCHSGFYRFIEFREVCTNL